jgi:hypothetical protein
VPGLSEDGRFEDSAAFDVGQLADEMLGLAWIERVAPGLGEMLRDLRDDLGAAGRGDAERGEPPLERAGPLGSGMLDPGDAVDRRDEILPAAALRAQHPAAGRGQAVVAAAALPAFSTHCPLIQPRFSRR